MSNILEENSIYELRKLVNTYNIALNNLNKSFTDQTSTLYNDIAQKANPIYNSIQNNNDNLTRISSFTNVYNYYNKLGKSNEALQIKTNIGYEWNNLDTSKKQICDFMGLSNDIDNMTLIGQISSLSQIIPSNLEIPLNNMIVYLNKVESCSNTFFNN